MNSFDRARLRATVDGYDALVRPARALTAAQARKRAELLAVLCRMTGALPSRARRRAGRLLKATDPTRRLPQKKKRGTEDIRAVVPRTAMPRLPDAVRVTGVVPTAMETNRRTH